MPKKKDSSEADPPAWQTGVYIVDSPGLKAGGIYAGGRLQRGVVVERSEDSTFGTIVAEIEAPAPPVVETRAKGPLRRAGRYLRDVSAATIAAVLAATIKPN